MSTAGPIDGTALRQVSATVAQALLSLLLALALVMLVRRLSGAFVQPLSGTAIVAAAAGLAIVAALVRLLIVGRFERTPYLVLSALPGVAVILLLAALTLSGTPAVAIA